MIIKMKVSNRKKKNIRLSIVVTVFKETYSIRQAIKRLLKKNRGYIIEIILVASPKSPNNTIKICKEEVKKNRLVKLYIQKNPGVGNAMREGMLMAKGDYVTIISADLETEPEAVDRMVKKIEETGCDVVLGSRWMRGGGFRKYNKIKLVLNWIFQQIFRVLFWTKITDISYGYKTLSKKVIRSINWTGNYHENYIETTIKPLKAGYYIEQIPTVWIGRSEGESVNGLLKNWAYVKKSFAVFLGKDKLFVNKRR